MQTRSQFEKSTPGAILATTIAPVPTHHRTGRPSTLSEEGWEYVTRDAYGNVTAREDADEIRARILRGFGHV